MLTYYYRYHWSAGAPSEPSGAGVRNLLSTESRALMGQVVWRNKRASQPKCPSLNAPLVYIYTFRYSKLKCSYHVALDEWRAAGVLVLEGQCSKVAGQCRCDTQWNSLPGFGADGHHSRGSAYNITASGDFFHFKKEKLSGRHGGASNGRVTASTRQQQYYENIWGWWGYIEVKQHFFRLLKVSNVVASQIISPQW